MVDIVFTGGGTAGHVTPNLALVPGIQARGLSMAYIGQKHGIEHSLVENQNLPFYPITAGKLRRYLDIQNLTDLFRIGLGFLQSLMHLLKLKPRLVFSKGGFVSCPVVWAAWVLRIPVIIHESDISPGLANKLSGPFAKKICYSFPETEAHIPKHKGVFTGVAIREFLARGQGQRGKKLCGFNNDKPCIVLIGGSQGARTLNKALRQNLTTLTESYNVCHICGKGNVDVDLDDTPDYKQFDYVDEALPDLFAMAELVISRAGATSIFELLFLKKANVLVPLPLGASRGDQILNAQSFEKQGFSLVLSEQALSENPDSLVEAVNKCIKNAENMRTKMARSPQDNANEKLLALIQETISDRMG